jgi:hypothetical protein
MQSISNYEKMLIEDQIDQSSNLRLRDYNKLFNLINITVNDIANYIKEDTSDYNNNRSNSLFPSNNWETNTFSENDLTKSIDLSFGEVLFEERLTDRPNYSPKDNRRYTLSRCFAKNTFKKAINLKKDNFKRLEDHLNSILENVVIDQSVTANVTNMEKSILDDSLNYEQSKILSENIN